MGDDLPFQIAGLIACAVDRLPLVALGRLVNDLGLRVVGFAAEFAAFIKEKLSACSVRFVETGRPVRRVAVGGGACASMLSDAMAAGCDTFVTADVKYDQYLEAKALGINLMDAGHFATEDVVCPALVQFLSRHFPKVEVRRTETHREAYDSV